MKTPKHAGDSVRKPKTSPQPTTPEQESSKHAPAPAEIRQRAFEIHIQRGGIHGHDLDDWLEAERELQEKYRNSSESATHE